MLGLNENQDDDIQEISVNTQDGMGQGNKHGLSADACTKTAASGPIIANIKPKGK